MRPAPRVTSSYHSRFLDTTARPAAVASAGNALSSSRTAKHAVEWGPMTILTTQRHSRREREFAAQLLTGKSMKDIAVAMNISFETVKSYAKSVYRKYSVHSARELAAALGMCRAPLCGIREAAARFTRVFSSQELDATFIESATRCTGAEATSLWSAVRTSRGVAFHGKCDFLGCTLDPNPILSSALDRGICCATAHDLRLRPRGRRLGVSRDIFVGISILGVVGQDFIVLRNPPFGVAETELAETVWLLARFAHFAPVGHFGGSPDPPKGEGTAGPPLSRAEAV